MSPKDAAHKILHQVFLPSSAQYHLFVKPQKRGLTVSPLCSLHTNTFWMTELQLSPWQSYVYYSV